jgi:chromosome partitioning protein
MTVAHLNQKGGVGKTTLTLHLACEWAREGKRVVLIDADLQGSALDLSKQRAKEGFRRLFGIAGLMRSALLAADLVLIPAQPSPFDGSALGEMLKLVDQARIFRPQLIARFVLNHCAACTVIARETGEALAEHEPPVLAARIRQRVSFADVARSARPGAMRDQRARPRNG